MPARIDHARTAEELFRRGYNCAQAVFCAFCDVTGLDVDNAAKLSSSFGGGLGRLRETCGTVSGAAMVLGAVYGYSEPGCAEQKNAHYELVREFARRFRGRRIRIEKILPDADFGNHYVVPLAGIPEGIDFLWRRITVKRGRYSPEPGTDEQSLPLFGRGEVSGNCSA